MTVGQWPEKILLDAGKEINDTDTEFKKLKNEFLNMEKHTKNWKLVSMNPTTQTNK